MCVLIFSTNLRKTFLILELQRDIINVHRSSSKVPVTYSCQVSVKLEFSRQILGKTLKYQIS